MIVKPKNELLRKLMTFQAQGNEEIHSNGVLFDFYSLLYNHYPDAIFTMDREGNFLDISDKVEEFIGYKPSELTGRNYSVVLKKEYLSLIKKYVGLALKGEPQSYTCEAIHKNGRTVYLSITNIPISINDEIVGVFGFAKNQTELV